MCTHTSPQTSNVDISQIRVLTVVHVYIIKIMTTVCSQLSHVEYCDYIFFLGQLVFLELILAFLFVFYDCLLMHPQFLHQSYKNPANTLNDPLLPPFSGALHLVPMSARCWRLGFQVLSKALHLGKEVRQGQEGLATPGR